MDYYKQIVGDNSFLNSQSNIDLCIKMAGEGVLDLELDFEMMKEAGWGSTLAGLASKAKTALKGYGSTGIDYLKRKNVELGKNSGLMSGVVGDNTWKQNAANFLGNYSVAHQTGVGKLSGLAADFLNKPGKKPVNWMLPAAGLGAAYLANSGINAIGGSRNKYQQTY